MFLRYLKTNSFWYKKLFPARHAAIRGYVRLAREHRETPDDAWSRNLPNVYTILLDIGADKLSARAFRDVCWRIIDELKFEYTNTWTNPDKTLTVFTGYWVDARVSPNPLHPMLVDSQVLPFLKHCREHNLHVNTLTYASWEAAAFINHLPVSSPKK